MQTQVIEVRGRQLQVSDAGDVYRVLKTGRLKILKQRTLCIGYRAVFIARKWHRVHRLVWLAFKGPIPDVMTIDHIDRCKTNNKLSNLRVVPRTTTNQRNRQKARVSELHRSGCVSRQSKAQRSRIPRKVQIL